MYGIYMCVFCALTLQKNHLNTSSTYSARPVCANLQHHSKSLHFPPPAGRLKHPPTPTSLLHRSFLYFTPYKIHLVISSASVNLSSNLFIVWCYFYLLYIFKIKTFSHFLLPSIGCPNQRTLFHLPSGTPPLFINRKLLVQSSIWCMPPSPRKLPLQWCTVISLGLVHTSMLTSLWNLECILQMIHLCGEIKQLIAV